MNKRARIGTGLHLLGLVALVGCSTPKPEPADPVTSQLASSGRAAYARGSYPQAVRFYQQALARARARNDGMEVARCAYNLAASELADGHPAAARVALREARLELARTGLSTEPCWLLEAKAARAEGLGDEAQRALDAAIAEAQSGPERSEAWVLRGQWAAEAGDATAAGQALERSRQVLGKQAAGALEAAQDDLSGRITLLKGEPGKAAEAFDAAADAWQARDQLREMAGALGRGGEARLAAGDGHGAADRFYRAARSLYGQGDAVGALTWIQKALAVPQGRDPDQDALLQALFESIRGEVEQAKAQAAGGA